MYYNEILNRFGNTLAENMRNFYKTIQGARHQLETLSMDASGDVTLFVTEIQQMKRYVQIWQNEIEKYKFLLIDIGSKLLVTQRYQFTNDWLSIDQVDGEWAVFKQILSKKSKTMDDQIPTLQNKILEEERIVNDKIKEIEEEWKNQRPAQGNVTPTRALDLLSIIGKKIITSKQEWIRICKAKELLDNRKKHYYKTDHKVLI